MATATKEQEKEEKFKDVRVIRGGMQIVLPEGMTYAEGRTWLTRQEEAEEKVVSIIDSIPAFPLDAIVALMRALKERYGFTGLTDTQTWMGPIPPALIQVPLADGGFETAPLGNIQPVTWEGGVITTNIDRSGAALTITGKLKRKHEPEVKEILKRTRELLKEKSIYKGQAVRLDLSFIHEIAAGQRHFDPMKDAPQFWDVDGVDQSMLILSKQVEFELASNIFLLIERTDDCRRNNIPLKHGALLMGPFGTGKTMTARVTAQKCVNNDWTFIYLKQAAQIAPALRLAELYAPAVLFTEDIDMVTSGERNADINEILNTIDGVDTKGKPIITILTTNNPEAISPALLRAGRIDTVVYMGAPDAPTAERFVRLYARDDDGHSLLKPEIDLTEAGHALAGFVPSFISEAVQKAKRFAIHREGADIQGKVSTEDLVTAATAMKEHFKMVAGRKAETQEEIVAKSLRNVSAWESYDVVPHRFQLETNGAGKPDALPEAVASLRQ